MNETKGKYGMDKAKVIKLREVINATLKAHPEFKGMSITLGNCRFDSASATFTKLAITEPAADGSTQDKTVIEFKARAFQVGLEGFHGKEVTINGKLYKIHGLNLRKRARPVILRGSITGGFACASVNMVKDALGIRAQYSL